MLQLGDRALAAWHLRGRDRGGDAAGLPDPSARAGTERLPEIRHIVLLMMENHSFDNYFGTLGHGDGFPKNRAGQWAVSNPSSDGSEVTAYRADNTMQHYGVPSQSWNASHIQYAEGKNSGFIKSIEQTVPGGDAKVAMGYWTEQDLPFYAGLARTFPLAERWFCSCLGPTFPNRRFLLAATANGLIDDIPLGMIDYPKSGTIFDLLDRHNISWVNYHHVKPWRALWKRIFGGGGLRSLRSVGLAAGKVFPSLMQHVQGNIQFTTDLYPLGVWRFLRHLRSIQKFFAHAKAGTLPAVSLVDPDFRACSEENPQDITAGEGFAAKVINAVMNGAGWEHTLLVWFYDEHGGYYDHVAPPPAPEPDDALPRSLLGSDGPWKWLLEKLGFLKQIKAIDTGPGHYDRYGFRVPAVVVSPYARPGYVSSTTYDHTSVLKLIENKWNLPPLTARDAAANDPLDMVDFSQPPAFLTPPLLPNSARTWPAVQPDVSAAVRVAQSAGLVGRTVVADGTVGTPIPPGDLPS